MPTTSSALPATPDGATGGPSRQGRGAAVLAYLALACSLIAAAALLWAPLVTTTSATSSSSGEVTGTVSHGSLLENEGSSIIVVLSIPVLLTLVGLVAHRRVRMVTAILLVIGCLLGLASIGTFFVPAAGLAIAAALRTPKHAGTVAR